MLTLGFDTATEVGSIGLIDEGEVIGEFTFGAKESQSERLLPSIDLLLGQADIDISEIEKLAVSRGPGSFTGLRIGISTAKGLAMGLGVPLVGVPLTTCYFTRVKDFPGPIYTLIKDRRNLVYYASFNETGDRVDEEESISIDGLKERINQQATKLEPALLVGDAVPKHKEKLTKIDDTILSEGDLNYPSGLQVALLGEKIQEDKDQLDSLEPLYAQRPIAEINWNSN
ncbi:MAG: tRNA (adenosine(37)-N6)-threonylcarbamoyltransferase complex dimerization subunit type 1 TsaB [Candidatus Bipolaricaulia bacterium]